jgi:hypothetical protein
MGVAPEQSAFFVQRTQVFVLVSQAGVMPEQLPSAMQGTH